MSENPTFYDQNFRSNDAANELVSRTYKAVQAIFNEFCGRNYSPRDVSHVMQSAIGEMELDHVIGLEPKPKPQTNGS